MLITQFVKIPINYDEKSQVKHNKTLQKCFRQIIIQPMTEKIAKLLVYYKNGSDLLPKIDVTKI